MHHHPFLGHASCPEELSQAASAMFTSKGNPFASLQPFRDEAALPKGERGVPNAFTDSTVPQALIAPAAVVATQTWDAGGTLHTSAQIQAAVACVRTRSTIEDMIGRAKAGTGRCSAGRWWQGRLQLSVCQYAQAALKQQAYCVFCVDWQCHGRCDVIAALIPASVAG